MSDILERLRELEAGADANDMGVAPVTSVELQQAADEIERLSSRLGDALSEVASYKAQMENIAAWAADWKGDKWAEAPVRELERILSPVVENRRDLFSELKEGLESIPVEKPVTICGEMFPPGQFSVQQCTLPKGHVGEHKNDVKGL